MARRGCAITVSNIVHLLLLNAIAGNAEDEPYKSINKVIMLLRSEAEKLIE